MTLSKLIRNFLFCLFAIYLSQDWLYTKGSFLSKVSIVLIIAVSGFYLIRTLLLNERKDLFYIAWTLFILLNTIGFLFSFDLSEGPKRDMFKQILGCLLPFYPFYYFAAKGELKGKHLIMFFLLILPIIIIKYYSKASSLLSESSSNNDDIVNNISYVFVRLIPFLFLVEKKRILSGGLMALLILFIIQGAKRGAIISGSIGLIMFFYYQLKTIERDKRIYGYLMTIIVFLAIAVFAYRMSIGNEFMINRMASIIQGNTSGRTEIYRSIFDSWYYNQNILNLLFGFGFAGSIELSGGNFAHNDWLELLSNFGVIGIAGYLFLFYAAARIIMNKEMIFEKRYLFLVITSIWFFISLVSMWYTELSSFTQSILLGYLLGSKNTTKY